MMDVKLLYRGARSATLELRDGGLYHTLAPCQLLMGGRHVQTTDTVVTSLFGLTPDTDYHITVMQHGKICGDVAFRTDTESYSLNVRRFGALGDGVHDDTAAIQAAITACPPKGRVLIPKGVYSVLPLFLKSHITVELQRGAELRLCTDRSRFPILPGMTLSTDETDEYNLGSWEGNPLDMYAALITGVHVEDTALIGEGVLNGQGDAGDWWVDPKRRRGAWRPRMLFLNRCEGFTMQGLTVKNSPSWNLHPYFSKHLQFLSTTVTAPANSPNTDGFDPESCEDILLAGVHFSLGDDCVAIKSGKLYMGARYQTPCRSIRITHCLMENGHGGVTVGSEMAGGVNDVVISACVMRNTDRGLRVKTRRGRGKDGVIDGITFDHVRMENVGTPFVVNCLYFCDPDGKSDYVQSREKQPVDDRTPRIGTVSFRHVEATGVSCAGYFLGLPEKPIERVEMEHVSISCSPDSPPMVPAMACGVEKCAQTGIVAFHVDTLVMRDVSITGQSGDEIIADGVRAIERS